MILSLYDVNSHLFYHADLCIVLESAYELRKQMRRWAQKQTETVDLVQSSDIIHRDV